MKVGVTLRNMGPQSRADWLGALAQTAQALEFESIWITDHIAIPPDDAQGSDGRYLDTLSTLAWLAAKTERIMLGSGVLILPYRPILAVAKQVATIQELSQGRLILGMGVGWMEAEFKAVGVPRSERGARTNQALEFLQRAFANDVVTANEQDFLFRPRPPQPELLIGGGAVHALPRALRFNIGWLPMVGHKLEQFQSQWLEYQQRAQDAGVTPHVSVMTGLSTESAEAIDRLAQLKALGVDRVICGLRYESLGEGQEALERIAGCVQAVNV